MSDDDAGGHLYTDNAKTAPPPEAAPIQASETPAPPTAPTTAPPTDAPLNATSTSE